MAFFLSWMNIEPVEPIADAVVTFEVVGKTYSVSPL